MDKSELQILQELASSGDTNAILELVNYYLSIKDFKNAFLAVRRFEYFTCELGYKTLGDFYLKGIGTPIDFDKAISYYSKGYELGNCDCGYQLASLLIKKKEYSSAIPYLASGVNNNHIPSIKLMANLYLTGSGVLENKDISINLLKRVLALGDQSVSDTLGRIYFSKQDYSEAFRYFVVGANNKNVNSIYHLGLCYAKGYGTRQDFNLARQYYQMGANMNEPRSLYNLSLYYRDGISVPKNEELALKLYEQAIQNGFKVN